MTNRTPLEEIGEKRISIEGASFFFKPSFRAINEMGTPQELVQLYASVNGYDYTRMMARINEVAEHSAWAASYLTQEINSLRFSKGMLQSAFIIMQSCCEDDCSVLIGGWKATSRGVKYAPGIMPAHDIIMIARDLIEHGMVGKSPLRVPLRSKKPQKASSEFKVSEFINSARAHFGMSRDEAEDLSMTEYQQIVKLKFPEPEGPTQEEHTENYNDAKALREQIAAKLKRKKDKKQ